MRKMIAVGVTMLMLLPALACQMGAPAAQTPTQVETDACCKQTPAGLDETLAAAPPAAASTPAAAAAPTTAAREIQPTWQPADAADPNVTRQGAMSSLLDPYQYDDIAAGSYRPDWPVCGEPLVASQPEGSGEILLSLRYAVPLLPTRLEIYLGESPAGIERIELLNSTSGLGAVVDLGDMRIGYEMLQAGACAQRMIVPVESPVAVDTVIIAFDRPASAAQVGAVEMLGAIDGYIDMPVFWRVPLPETPTDIAYAPNGMIYVAAGSTGLYAYDVEGNQLKQYSVPDQANLTAVSADGEGNMIAVDAGYGWWIQISPEGEHLAIGGNAPAYQAAVSPVDGSLYLLRNNVIEVHSIRAVEKIAEITLDEMATYAGLAFDPQGTLYTLRNHAWEPERIGLDPHTGEIIEEVPLVGSLYVETVAVDLAFDASGNGYILYSLNAGQTAIDVIDPQTQRMRRFGRLTGEAGGWPEGEFLDPRAIAVSPDGRFIIVADGYDDRAYLTAYRWEPE